MPRLEWNADYFDSCCFSGDYKRRTCKRCVGAPHNHIGSKPPEQIRERIALDFKHVVYSRKSRQNLSALSRGRNGALHTWKRAIPVCFHSLVAQHAHDDDVAARMRLFQQTNVPRMKQVEAARHKHDAFALAFPFPALEYDLFLRDDLAQFSAPSVRNRG